MDLGTIVDNIGRRTGRPDKGDDIIDAVNDAIEFATVNGSFAGDLVESSTTIDDTLYVNSVVISTTFTRFRKIKYLRPADYKKFLTWRSPDQIFDDQGNECLDVWYRAGDNIQIKLSTLQETLYYGYYQFPARMSADADTNWMLDNMYAAIFNLACGDIFQSVGNDSEAARYQRKGEQLLISHRRDHQDGVEHA